MIMYIGVKDASNCRCNKGNLGSSEWIIICYDSHYYDYHSKLCKNSASSHAQTKQYSKYFLYLEHVKALNNINFMWEVVENAISNTMLNNRKIILCEDITLKRKVHQCECPDHHWRCWSVSSTSPVMTRTVTLMILLFLCICPSIHDDVMKWKHFLHYWPFVRGIHRSPVNSLICALNKRLSKQSWGWWFETPSCSLWRHCNEMHSTAECRHGMDLHRCNNTQYFARFFLI